MMNVVRDTRSQAHRRRGVHLNIANKSSLACEMFADGFQRFPSQSLFRVEKEPKGRNHIEGVTEILLSDVDLLQPDVVRTGREGEHESGYIHSHDLSEMFSRDSRYAACSAGEVETSLLWPAQRSQRCLD